MQHKIIHWIDQTTRKPSALRFVAATGALVMMAVLALLFWQVGALAGIAQDNSSKLASAAATARARGQALGTANDRLHSVGVPTVNPTSQAPNPTDTNVGGVPEVTGPAGPSGATGRGIVATKIEGGHLVVTFSDGAHRDVGEVVGPQGAKGSPGPSGKPGLPGNGITAATVAGGDLVLDFTSGATRNLGPVVGPRGAEGDTGATGPEGDTGAAGKDGVNGRGVKAVTVSSDGHLIVTYSDDSTYDAGPLPRGPKGDTGPAGPSGPKGDQGDRGPAGPTGAPGTSGPTVAGIACSGSDLTITITMSDGTTYTAHCAGPPPTGPAPSSTPAPPPSSSSTPPPVTP